MNGGAVDSYGTSAQEWHDDEAVGDDQPSLTLAGEIIEVRRNAAVAAVVGSLASAVAIAWFGRAISSGALLDWLLVGVLGVVAVAWLAAVVDARTPLLVADDQGVRLRLGRAWVGLPWSAVARVEHRPRRGLLRDGVLSVVAHTPDRVLAQLGRPARRQASLAQRMYGGPLALPLGLSTRVVGADDDLTAGLDALASRGAAVVVVGESTSTDAEREHVVEETAGAQDLSRTTAEVAEATEVTDVAVDHDVDVAREETADEVAAVAVPVVLDPDAVPDEVAPGRAWTLVQGVRTRVGSLVTLRRVSRDDMAPERPEVEVEVGAEDVGVLEVEPSETPAPLRSVVHPARTEVVSSVVTLPAHDRSDDEEFFEEDRTWGERVRPIAQEGHAVAPVVVDDFVVEPAADPVVGPELRAARTRLGLTTDQLAERTRIRPHVIEAIEVDDFVPCGGDFYARGHLRTLARVLGIDVAPLLVAYDERYAHAPVDPRRVFEAELATGAHGSIRGTRGGPNWSILVAVVMAVVLAWSVARLVMDAPRDVTADVPVLNGSGGPGGVGSAVAEPVKVRVEAPTSGAEVVVRDAGGEVVFRGRLAIGESTEVKASPPVRVQASDGTVTVAVAGTKRGPVGEAGEPAQGTYAE